MTKLEKQIKRKKTLSLMKKNWVLYIFLIPMLVYLIIFSYLPLYGIQIAFKNYKVTKGIWGSPWVGFEHFKTFFDSYQFWNLLRNTLTLSIYSLIAGFPLPIIFAIILQYCISPKLKKTSQMISYAPHFISVVVFCGMITIFLANNGIINQILGKLGFDGIKFLSNPKLFKHIYVWSGVLQGLGWGSIMYIAVLTNVNPELHEAAIIDGANKLQRIKHVDIPAIVPTMVIMLITKCGEIMDVGFEKVLLLQNSVNLDYSEVISTYVYKIGILGGQFSYSSAIELFNNVINLILLVLVNWIARKVSDISLW